ncbi:GDSL-type esterase/lipase family protein, partial [Microgenomates group bacterium]|nr:GDSL-type esterase/lipase family protein [Microgenomates group bacterium]
MSHYIIFGDSIGCGEGDPQGGWAKLLGEKYSVKNLSIDGATTNDYLKNFPADIDKNSTLIIALGVNDSAWVPLEKYKNNLLQLIKLGKKYTDKIILISPAPIDQVKADPVPWAPEIS